MKKFFSLVLALVMALSLTTVAWGAIADTDAAKIGDTGYATLAAAVTAATDGDEIVLLKDVADGVGIVIDKKLTIDFGGYTYTFASNPVGSAGTESQGFQILKAADAVTLKNGTLTSKAGSDVKMLINNYCNLTLDGMTLIGTNLDDATQGKYVLSNNAGDVVIEDTTITAAADGVAFDSYNYSAGGYTIPPTVTVKGTSVVNGKVESAGGKLVVEAGTFNGEIAVTNTNDVSIKGGTFATDVSAYVDADDYQQLANGSVVPASASNAIAPTLYQWNNTTAKWDTYDIALGMDLDDLKMDASDNCLPCYCVNGKYFVETTSAAATYKLTYGAAKTVFLAPVDSSDVRYSAKASVLKVVDDEDATCGDWYVADLDEDDVYYISYDKKGVVVEGVYVAAKNGPVQILVKGKIVDVKSLTQDDIKQLPHDWKGYDVVNHEYTTVKCANCGKVATLYANGTAAGKNAVKVTDNGTVLGYITAAADSFGAASAGTSTDKTVTSADTFDAGIAMYVGMSVMAAAGSAVVIGKKKD